MPVMRSDHFLRKFFYAFNILSLQYDCDVCELVHTIKRRLVFNLIIRHRMKSCRFCSGLDNKYRPRPLTEFDTRC